MKVSPVRPEPSSVLLRTTLQALQNLSAMNVLLIIAIILGTALLAAALLAPVLSPFEPDQQRLLARLLPPIGYEHANPRYLLGTDQLGRDILSRCIYGLRLTLVLGLFGTVIGIIAGVTVGLVSGQMGGLVDSFLMGIVDIKLSMPFTLVALFVIALAGSSISVLVIVLGLSNWAQFARIVRAQVLALRDLPYIEAARSIGASPLRIGLKHMLPNIVSPIVIMATLNFSNLILLESSLSFLGLGVRPPTATLGAMVGQGRDFMASAPWIVAAPGLLIVVVAFVAMLLGDLLRDQVDVRLRDR
jgi:peptide/nickel transport system permease protein